MQHSDGGNQAVLQIFPGDRAPLHLTLFINQCPATDANRYYLTLVHGRIPMRHE